MDIETILEEWRQDTIDARALEYLEELREQEIMSTMLTSHGSDDCSGTFRWDYA